MLLGCIADDLTGATDLGVTLAREGLSVIQVNGVPEPSLDIPAADAIVVALKSRTNAAAEAVAWSLASLSWLRKRGARAHLLQVLLDLRLDRRAATSARWPTRCSMRLASASPSPRRPIRATAAPSTKATSSSATCRSPNPACATIRSRRCAIRTWCACWARRRGARSLSSRSKLWRPARSRSQENFRVRKATRCWTPLATSTSSPPARRAAS